MRLVAAALTAGPWFFRLLPNIVGLVVTQGIAPRHRSGDGLAAFDLGDQSQAGRLEAGRQRETALDLLEVFEGKRKIGGLTALSERGALERDHLVALYALDGERQ